jgi:ABC-2 type transport system ATP-binding protein
LIEVEQLSFEYPGKRALDEVTFALAPRSVTALVGPNGAGKSTLLRCLAGLSRPLSGKLRVSGVDVLDQPREVRARIGYMGDFFGLYDELSAAQCLTYTALARGYGATRARDAVARAAERVGLGPEHLGRKAGALSRGLRQRLAIAQAILHEPSVLLLDEPASGLDPEARIALASLFVSLREQGITLLVSSHILAELEAYSTHMLLLRDGRIAEHVALAGSAQRRGRALRMRLVRALPGLAEILAASSGVARVKVDGASACFEFSGDEIAQHALLAGCIAQGVPVCALAEERTNLQDAYLAQVQGGAPR